MSTINLAFSGGIESTYLLQKLLSDNNRVHIVFANLCGGAQGYAGEMLRAKQILDYFRKKIDEPDGPYTKSRLGNIYWHIGTPYLNGVSRYKCSNSTCNENVTTSVTQQFAITDVMMNFRKERISKHYPTTVLGWLKEDTTEYSLNEYDFTEAEYRELLNLPVRLGRLTNSDLIAKPFRAPLWEMRKTDIWRNLDTDLKHLVLPNGKGELYDDHFIHNISLAKRLELEHHQLPFNESYKIPVPDDEFGFFVRLLLDAIHPSEFGLPSEASGFVNTCRTTFIQKLGNIVEDEKVKGLKKGFEKHMKSAYEYATKFVWPVPIPTVEVFADVGDGAERVELIGER